MAINVGSFPASPAKACMDRDMALIRGAEGGYSLACIYEWARPAVSVPRSFQGGNVYMAVLDRAGIEFIKRPTGGGILVHGFDLSFSVAVPRTGIWDGLGIEEAGKKLAEPVVKALIGCGFKASFRGDAGDKGGKVAVLCANQKSPLDIMISGNKVGAFAQRRTAKALFQHGSILVKVIPDGIQNAILEAGLGTLKEWHASGQMVSPLESLGRVDLTRLRKVLEIEAGGVPDGGLEGCPGQ